MRHKEKALNCMAKFTVGEQRPVVGSKFEEKNIH